MLRSLFLLATLALAAPLAFSGQAEAASPKRHAVQAPRAAQHAAQRPHGKPVPHARHAARRHTR